MGGKIFRNYTVFGFEKKNDFSGGQAEKFVKYYPKKFFAFFTDFVDNSVEKVENSLKNRTFFVLTEKIRQKKNFFDILTQDIGVWHGTEKNSRRAFRKRAFARRI